MSVKYLVNGLELKPKVQIQPPLFSNFQWIGHKLNHGISFSMEVSWINITSTKPVILTKNGETLISIPPVQNYTWKMSKSITILLTDNLFTNGEGYINFGGVLI